MRSSRSSAATRSTRSSGTTPRPPSWSAPALPRRACPPKRLARRRAVRRRRRASFHLMIRPILRYGADVLHAPAEPVGEITADIQQLIDDMIQTMYAAPGVGLAATQIGV